MAEWCSRNTPSPFSSPFITTILEGLLRSLAKPVVKKAPINLEILGAMVSDTNENPTLANTRLTCACLLGFAGFLHFDELSKLQPTDLSIDKEKLTIRITHSKTDQLRKGDELLISKSTDDTYPVRMLERCMSKDGIQLSDSRPLFKGITKTKTGETLRISGSLFYSR